MIYPISFEGLDFNQETWKPIDIFNIRKDLYEVSSFGRFRRKADRFIMKQYIHKTDYSCYFGIHLLVDNEQKPKAFLSHRVVGGAFYGILNDQVNHKNNIGLDNFIYNLEWCSCEYNSNYSHINKFGFSSSNAGNAYLLMSEGYPNDYISFSTNMPLYTIERIRVIYNLHLSGIIQNETNQFIIANSAKYSYEEVSMACRLIEQGLKLSNIAKEMNIDISDKLEYYKFRAFITNLRTRKSYTNISSAYNW